MNKLELYQELAYIVDDRIEVIYSDDNMWHSVPNNYVIEIPKVIPPQDLQDAFQSYFLIDCGMEYYKYCSNELFSFLHELGHIINGLDVSYPLQVKAVQGLNKPPLKRYEMYIILDDEWYAWDWAYEFIIKNKKMIRRLTYDLQR